MGRLNYHNIFSNQSFSNNCKDNNCDLCLNTNKSFCLTCKYNFTVNKITKEKICEDELIIINGIEIFKRNLNINKNQILENIQNITNSIKIGKTYEMFGNDFVILIKPTTSPDIPSFTRIDFSSCEDILRNYYKIYKPRIITFLQVEINNTNDFSLINQIEYQAYDDDKNLLNLSLCNNSNINIFYSIK